MSAAANDIPNNFTHGARMQGNNEIVVFATSEEIANYNAVMLAKIKNANTETVNTKTGEVTRCWTPLDKEPQA